MTHTRPSSERQLLVLVRASLWQLPADETWFSKDVVDWQKLGQLALQQTVGILAFEAALSLPQYLRPPKEWIQKAFSFIEANRRTHMIIDVCVAESISKLRNAGIEAVLLKGQAYARAYPRPDMRQCGDIDLYVGEASYRLAYEAVKRFGWKREERFLPKAKHYGCWLRGIRIELHRITGQLPWHSADRKFQQWSRTQLNESPEYLVIGGEKVKVPTPVFDVVFVFMHLYHHFLNGGIGLRHVCDWTMLMHAHAKDINTSELVQKLKEYRLLNGWKSFAPIAVDHLGLPEAECPFYSIKYRRKSERILAMIMKEGNFGRANRTHTPRPESYI
ncbi:MAG: nucleotidyltransferase family protein, partial [Muribaculaceae bacterium]|nr:nucleotidyltransferase family protein [Muribaculaceae bacterium]